MGAAFRKRLDPGLSFEKFALGLPWLGLSLDPMEGGGPTFK